MPRKFKAQVYPSNGYVFRDSDGFVHSADGWKALEARVIDYRIRNNIPLGDPWEEIVTQVCAGVPSLCYDDKPFELMKSGNDFNWHVVQWFSHAAGYRRLGLWRRIDDATAAARAKICSTCPMQRALNSSCGACITSINNLRKAIIGGPSKHQGLAPCAVQWEDCQTTVHIDIPPDANPAFPAHCWRRKN